MCELDEKALLARLPFRARDLLEMESRLGPVRTAIEAKISSGLRPVVVEVGFGYGTVLMELRKAYGASIELHGINQLRDHGDLRVVRWNALRQGTFSEVDLDAIDWPVLHFGDVADGLPFADKSVDMIISQTAFYLFKAKAFFMEEVSRVLKTDGVGRIDVSPVWRADMPIPYASLFEIWNDGHEIPFWDYLSAFPNMEQHIRPKGGHYLQINGGRNLDLQLRLVTSLHLPSFCPRWIGTKSIYACLGRADRGP